MNFDSYRLLVYKISVKHLYTADKMTSNRKIFDKQIEKINKGIAQYLRHITMETLYKDFLKINKQIT